MPRDRYDTKAEPGPWLGPAAPIGCHLPRRHTFVQHGAEDGQAVVDGGAVPPATAELVLALLDADPETFCHAGHDLDVVSAEAQLLGDQARDAGTEDGLHAQR